MNVSRCIPNNLNDLSKEELISIINQLKSPQNISNTSFEKKEKEPFNFNKYKKRHVALKFLYLGWDYCGFAIQTHTEKTIESQIFKALLKTKLIQSRETSNYHRCGRTDKGVSAFSQVISLDLRSTMKQGVGIVTPDGYIDSESCSSDKEIDYPTILNRVLPPEIKMIAWAPVDPTFSARFDCKQRTYKYFFPVGNLNLERIQEAGKHLIGEHDFRNLCKMDVGNGVVNYVRKIFSVDIQLITKHEQSYDMAELTIVGQAFLWHQIRCIISILFLVGQGKENIDIIGNLLDITNYPKKPQYDMASEIPLVLYNCSFEDVPWIYDKNTVQFVIKNLQTIWTQHSVKATILRKMLIDLEHEFDEAEPVLNQSDCLIPGVRSRVYKRLLDRQCCESLEYRIEQMKKKQKR